MKTIHMSAQAFNVCKTHYEKGDGKYNPFAMPVFVSPHLPFEYIVAYKNPLLRIWAWLLKRIFGKTVGRKKVCHAIGFDPPPIKPLEIKLPKFENRFRIYEPSVPIIGITRTDIT